MYTQVFAKSAVNEDSKGKTSRVWSDVDKLRFRIDRDKSLLVIEASCYDEKGYGLYDVERDFLLELEKTEVEKLVSTALNEKLLKQLDIKNLSNLDKVSPLELELDRVRKELGASKKDNAELRRRIKRAANALSGFAA